ncbi:hypothetical protein D9757_005211 [Collybiopsis confluens]|uniref:Tc1-like transposase DDE domain-containing protein n=1 Tax=Collybiopsis confluens TaxID=2823264 RepID=A0A8H5G1Q8_9AGAR|nr:hypothetical protein D9757_012532 [Collybiopsis confluens]KAF5390430.1 hypothetical protein D9757_005211 [Collybiopsis confluens]
MPRLLDIDLRKRIVQWRVREGKSAAECGELAGCCENTVRSITSLYLDMGVYRNSDARALGRPRLLTMEDKAYVLSILKDNPTLYLDEIQDMMWYNRSVDISISTLSRNLREMAMSHKKVSYQALQQSQLLRATWLAAYADIPMDYMVWLDESGIERNGHQRTNGWGVLGSACTRRAIWLRGERFSVLPALTKDGIVALEIFKGTVNREMFVDFLKEHLAPTLTPYPGPRSVVILDNASIHHDLDEIRAIIVEECGARLIYLPPYSPDFNPAEQAFSFIKSWLRRRESEVINDITRAWLIHRAAEEVTPELAEAWILNCGYD